MRTTTISRSSALAHLRAAEQLTHILDTQFSFLGACFGLDPILGLIPGVGDAASTLLSLYLVWIGTQLELPSHKLAQMLGNSVLDFLVGIVPVLGDIGDFAFKANSRNLALLKQHLEEQLD